MIGQTISHYKILEKLGEGGMGVVYKAEDLTLDRQVALKFLSKELSFDESAKKRFIREAKAASALEHPNICAIYEIGQAPDGRLFTVMPCYEGRTLRDRLDEGPLSIDEALDIASQVASALVRAHEKGIVHRDIKPGNVMLTDGGRQAKLMDFGLARRLDATRVTRTGTTVGTVAYMSPEQALGKETDHRTDIWSLGVMVYEMLTCRLPFRGEVETALLYSILHQDPESVTVVRRDVPLQIENLIEKALAKDLGERYATTAELLTDLEEQRDKLSLGIKERRFITLRRKTRKRLFRVLVPTGVVVVAALAVFIYQKFKPIPPEAIARENSMAIMYFENMADPEDSDKTAGMITSLLTTGLGDSDYIKVVSRQRVYDILKQMGKENREAADRETASEVAKRAGVNYVMTGAVIQTDPNLVVSIDIWHALSGEVRAGVRKRFDTGADVMTVADALIRTVGDELSLPRLAAKQLERSVGEVTTQSEDAYRYYVEGMDYLQRGYVPEARTSFEMALEHDSTFAMAYLRLATGVSGDQEEKVDLLKKAESHSQHASKKDRLYIKSARARFLGNITEAIEGFEALAEMYPDEKQTFFELGGLYSDRGDLDKAIANYERVIELDPFEAYAYSHLSGLYRDRNGNLEASLSVLDRAIALMPDHPDPYDTRAWLYAYEGRLDDAIASYDQSLERIPGYFVSLAGLVAMHLFKRDYNKAQEYCRRLVASTEPWERGVGGYLMAFIPLYQGELNEGLETLNLWISTDELAGFAGDQYANKLSLRSLVHLEKGNRELAVADRESFMSVVEGTPLEHWLLFEQVYLYARAGEFSEADRILAARLSKIDRSSRSQMQWYWTAKGALELEKDNLDAACDTLEKVTQTAHGMGEWLARYLLAMSHFEAGRMDIAVQEFEKAFNVYEVYRASYPIEAVKMYYFAGRAYEQIGMVGKAVQQYEQFLDIWKDADPGLEVVDDARRRLSALETGVHEREL